jgi:peptide/nickel transport system permease protein
VSTVGVAEALPGGVSALRVAESPRLLRRLLRRPLAVACIVYLLIVVVTAIVAPLVLPNVGHEQAGDLYNELKGPSWAHPLGTDSVGRDVLDRILVGSRVTMLGVGEALVTLLAISLPLGLAAGYLGGRVDRVVGWLTDLTFATPAIAIVLVALTVFPRSMLAGMVTLGVLLAPAQGRIIRSATLPIREELYIAAARVSGLSHSYIVVRHVLSRIAGPVIVLGSLFAAVALLAQTGLAYLGLIVAPPEPSWGGMVGDGIANIITQPWLIIPPGIVMGLTIMAFGLLGDAVRDANAESWSSAPVRRARPRRVEARAAAAAGPASDALLSVENLTVTFPSPEGPVTAVEGVSFTIGAGETVGIVGESGCGKTLTAVSLLGLLPGQAEIADGRIFFDGRDIAALPEAELRRVRGKGIGLISQEPMISLNPAFRVGWQLALAVRTHHGGSRAEARARAVELLRSVHLPEPELVARRYPHELSGGMAQRVAIARALAGEPKLLIADEPTTALDVTVQADILELLRELQRQRGMAILLVTHDWGVVADICDRAVVMYAGQVVEQADLAPIFKQPLHPYTEALFASNPHLAQDDEDLPAIPGSVPKPGSWPEGCHFHPRCRYVTAACRAQAIPLEQPVEGRLTRCIHSDQLLAVS